MPLLGFKKRFAPMVENGLLANPDPSIPIKRQSIRAKRKDGRNPHPGETLYLYTGLRTKSCRKLGENTCKSVQEITIDWHDTILGGEHLYCREALEIAEADGFHGLPEFYEFFAKEHGLPFWGLLIKW